MEKRQFLRRAVKVGNSSGVLLPKSFLGAEVRVIVLNRPIDPKKFALKILEPIIEDIAGIFIFQSENKKAEFIAVSNSVSKIIEKENHKITVIPLQNIKKMIKEKNNVAEKIFLSKPVMNKALLQSLKKEIH